LVSGIYIIGGSDRLIQFQAIFLTVKM